MPPTARHRATIHACAAALLLAGCVPGRNWNPFAEAAAPVFSPDAGRDEVVAHLNGNISRCTGWRSTEVKIKSNGLPLSAGAMMAVESPRRFRMLVTAMGADLADLGSNDERMWIWMRPASSEVPQYIETCAHDDFEFAQRRLEEQGLPPVPFRPDWLMEVLGVIPIDPAQVELEPNPGDAGQLLLSSYQAGADGTRIKRVVTVDAKRGVVVGHGLWSVDESGAIVGGPIAQAKLSEYRRDERSGVTLPHRIELSYPAANAEMTLTIKEIEVNPLAVTPNTWRPAAARDCPYRDLASGRVVTLDQAGTF